MLKKCMFMSNVEKSGKVNDGMTKSNNVKGNGVVVDGG